MPLRQLIYEVAHPFLGLAARNRTLVRWLFGVRVPSHVTVHFDPTTYLLKQALHQVVTPQDVSALEMGIGQGALLTLHLLLTTRLEVEGIDCSETRVRSSEVVAHHNGLTPRFFVSDLFGQVPAARTYDLIFFNPPYVPTREGSQLGLTRRMRADSDRVWDGGAEGTQVLEDFLMQVPPYLSMRGRVLFGVQNIFVSDDQVKTVVERCGLVLLNRITRCCIPSVVYITRPAVRRGGEGVKR